MDSLPNPARILLVLVVLGLQAVNAAVAIGMPRGGFGFDDKCTPATGTGVCGGVSSCAAPAIPSPCCGGAAPSCGCGGGGGCGSYGCYNVKRSKLAVASARTEEVFGFGQHGKSRKSQQQGPAPSFGRGADGGAKELLETSGLVAFNAETQPSSPMEKPMEHQREQPLSPNERFLRCCEGRKLPDACLAHCNFQTYTKAALTRMYMKQDACPIYAAPEIHFCAAQGQDHRSCCIRSGVANTLAGQQCLVFCDQTPGKFTRIDITYMACFDRFETMKACFWHGMGQQNKKKVNIFA